jgi:hypothetical protein
MASTPTRPINLARQLVAIRLALPAARGKIDGGQLDCVMPIQPSPASQTYRVRLHYKHWQPPSVHVIEPRLAVHPGSNVLPHVYPGNELCLYYPGEWQHDMLLAATIFPWSAEWLLHYEIWLTTRQWTGGGRHPPRRRTTPPPRRRSRQTAQLAEWSECVFAHRDGGDSTARYGRS